MTVVKMPIALICTFLWVGFVCAISFMEAWLKFRAPGINLPLGLGIGRIVFNALNKVEWVFALMIIINIFLNTSDILKWQNLSFVVPLILLLIQTFWLLPALDAEGDSIASATSFKLTFLSSKDCSAMKIDALIPYSQAFENIFYFLSVQR